jgi:hypothetical protein
VFDGVIKEASGNWYESMGYLKTDLINHRYDEGFFHPEDAEKIKNNQMNILKSTGIKEYSFDYSLFFPPKQTILLYLIVYTKSYYF